MKKSEIRRAAERIAGDLELRLQRKKDPEWICLEASNPQYNIKYLKARPDEDDEKAGVVGELDESVTAYSFEKEIWFDLSRLESPHEELNGYIIDLLLPHKLILPEDLYKLALPEHPVNQLHARLAEDAVRRLPELKGYCRQHVKVPEVRRLFYPSENPKDNVITMNVKRGGLESLKFLVKPKDVGEINGRLVQYFLLHESPIPIKGK